MLLCQKFVITKALNLSTNIFLLAILNCFVCAVSNIPTTSSTFTSHNILLTTSMTALLQAICLSNNFSTPRAGFHALPCPQPMIQIAVILLRALYSNQSCEQNNILFWHFIFMFNLFINKFFIINHKFETKITHFPFKFFQIHSKFYYLSNSSWNSSFYASS